MGSGATRMSCVKKESLAPKTKLESDGKIYHEKQSKELCALHALNNLFQDSKAFTKHDLDNICVTLSPSHYLNPHRSMLGLGNYDVNVIMAALQIRDCDTIWFDKRKDIGRLVLSNIKGFILNIPSDYKWGIVRLPLHRKHWICIRQIGLNYYNLDSKLDDPEVIGKEPEVKTYLKEQINSKEKELLLVVCPEVARDGSWYTNEKTSRQPRRSGDSSKDNKDKTSDYSSKHSSITNSPENENLHKEVTKQRVDLGSHVSKEFCSKAEEHRV